MSATLPLSVYTASPEGRGVVITGASGIAAATARRIAASIAGAGLARATGASLQARADAGSLQEVEVPR